MSHRNNRKVRCILCNRSIRLSRVEFLPTVVHVHSDEDVFDMPEMDMPVCSQCSPNVSRGTSEMGSRVSTLLH